MDSDGYGLKFKLVDFLDRYGFKLVQGSYAIRVVCILGEWVLKKCRLSRCFIVESG